MAGVKGRTGRKKTPTAVLVARGASVSALPESEPKPPRSSFEPPPHLSIQARRFWAEAIQHLDSCGVITTLDEAALAQYCEHFSIHQEALLLIRKNGLLVKNKRGLTHANPAIAIAHRTQEVLLKIMREFGMTPSSRTDIKTRPGFTPPPDPVSPKFPQNRFALVKGCNASL